MDPRVIDIMGAALELGREERERYLTEACGGDASLRAAIDSLIIAHAKAEGFLDSPTAEIANATRPFQGGEGPGSRIGPYHLLQQIGEGGFGLVFMAEQETPVRRRVALKIVKLGMDTQQVIARFEQERQALAMMDHPNIATVLDAGTTDSGRPYFVMELVRGVPITRYCDENNLTVRDRIELLIPVCQAVQHAHQKGIIHRDIKPSNILVTTRDGVPAPVVIDFGIAKATSARLTERTLFTEHNQLVGTPAYMSPEQAEMSSSDIDTRTDVYSLGVLLYELLTGTTPFDSAELRRAGYAEILRIIREVEPPRPSTRVSTLGESLAPIAAKRRTEPDRLGFFLRGDADWIVMRAMDKDRKRRYASASEFADDLRRFLDREPVAAAPPSTAYRARKFIARHRLAVSAAAAIGGALLTGAIVATVGLVQAHEQRAAAEDALKDADAARTLEAAARVRADAERDKALLAADFLGKIIEGVGPSVARGRDTTMLNEIMEQAALRIESGELKASPQAEVWLRRTIGGTLAHLAREAEADRMLSSAVELAEKTYRSDHHELAHALMNLAWFRMVHQARLPEAETLARRAVEMYRRVMTRDDENVVLALNTLAGTISRQGRDAEAEKIYREAGAINDRLGRSDTLDGAECSNNLAGVLVSQGHAADAEPLYRSAVAIYERESPADGIEFAATLNNLGVVLHDVGKYSESLAYLQRALEMRRRILSAGHPDIGQSATNLSRTLQTMGRLGEAEPVLRESVDILRAAYPEGHPTLATSLGNLATLLQALGKPADAEPLHREALQMRRKLLDANHPDIGLSLSNLAGALQMQSRPADAEPLFKEALGVYRAAYPGDHPGTATCLNNLGGANLAQNRPEVAADYFREALAMRKRVLPAGHPEIAGSAGNLGAALRACGKPAEAEPLLREALQMRRSLFPGDHPQVASNMSALALCLLDLNKPEEALSLASDAAEMAERILPPEHPVRKRCDDTFAKASAAQNKP